MTVNPREQDRRVMDSGTWRRIDVTDVSARAAGARDVLNKIDDDATKLYRTLLGHPLVTSASLSALAGFDGRTCAEGLEALRAVGLVRQQPDGRWEALSPRLGYGRLLSEADQEVRAREQALSEARATLNDLVASHAEAIDTERITRHLGIDRVQRRLVELSMDAREEILSFNPGRDLMPESRGIRRPLHQQALASGVRVRCLYQESSRRDPDTLAYVEWLAAAGGSARTVPAVPFNLILIDQSVALLPANPHDHREGAVEISTPGVILGLVALFEQVWSGALPFAEQACRDDRGLLPRERELLRLLAEGHTDESAARRLDVSVRTARRMMADLTQRLDADSRFSAGVRAARRGWI